MEIRLVGKWITMHSYDNKTKEHTLFCSEGGGAIISDKNLAIAEEKFIEAMQIAEVVSRLNQQHDRQ